MFHRGQAAYRQAFSSDAVLAAKRGKPQASTNRFLNIRKLLNADQPIEIERAKRSGAHQTRVVL
jgi:hypothetical protein